MNKSYIPLPERSRLIQVNKKLFYIEDRERNWKIYIGIESAESKTSVRMRLEIWQKQQEEKIISMYEQWKETLKEKMGDWQRHRNPACSMRAILNEDKYINIKEDSVRYRKDIRSETKEKIYDFFVYVTQCFLVFLALLVFIGTLYLPIGLVWKNYWSLVYVPMELSGAIIGVAWLYNLYVIVKRGSWIIEVQWFVHHHFRRL